MNLLSVLNDRRTLQIVARDAHNDVQVLCSKNKASSLFGDVSVSMKDVQPLLQVLAYLQTNEAPLWQLQYMFWIVAYLSEPLMTALQHGTPQQMFKAWKLGPPHSFRTRVKNHLLGEYSAKIKKGSRKMVTCCATPPHMAITAEYLLIHTLSTTTQF